MLKFQYLMNLTKILSDNIRILHRNLIGTNWFDTHELLEKYYKYIDDVQDDINEIGIMLGLKEQSVLHLIDVYPAVPTPFNFTEVDALQYVYNFFKDLIEAIENVKDDVPGDVYSHLEEYIFFLRKEADYKITQRLKGK